MPNLDRERTTAFEIISLAHYVASMAIILITFPIFDYKCMKECRTSRPPTPQGVPPISPNFPQNPPPTISHNLFLHEVMVVTQKDIVPPPHHLD